MSKWYDQHSFSEIQDNEIHIWINYLNVHEARIKHLYPLLSSKEKERSERFKFYKHRKNFIASHGFLHTVLAYYTDTPANEIEFSTSEKGKPSLLKSLNPNNIQFNLSHSNTMAILAVSKKHTLGVDIEYADKKVEWAAISRRFFTKNEQSALFKLPEDEQKDAFFKIWTRKEAHMKVTGLGLSLSPTQFEVSVPPADAQFLGHIENIDNKNTEHFKMQDIILPDMFKNYSSCLSADFDYDIKNITHFIHT